MKRMIVGRGLLSVLAMMAMLSCEKEVKKDSLLDLSMKQFVAELNSKSPSAEVTDTNEFILSIKDGTGVSLYYGKYKDRPATLSIAAGSYELSVVSYEQTSALFDIPQYGDVQVVSVAAGETIKITFGCRQTNAAIKMQFTDAFLAKFAGASIVLRQSEEVYLDYQYNETRIAYFPPGKVDINLKQQEKEVIIISKTLNASEVLTLKLSASEDVEEGEVGLSIVMDTTRIWVYEEFVVGNGRDGSTAEKALMISDLGLYDGMKNLWVKGYIVGSDMTITKVNFNPPFEANTHLALSDISNPVSRSECAAVELPSGSLRSDLNLSDHPENLGKMIFVKGNIESYYGQIGVKNIKEYLYL